MAEPVVLGYWNARGMTERIRQLMEYCKLPYTQQIYIFDDPDSRNKWFNEDKPKLI